ncbi:MAG: BASS family bile acid:Na+ symporter [Chitinophagales bacterium]
MIDQVQLNFNSSTLFVLNIILGFILFGVSLDLKWQDFKLIYKMPKEVLVGLSGQLILLPLLTAVLIFLIKPQASLALGMILVASCPGGNLSNFMTHHAKGNTALSVTLTTLATSLAVLFTPINFYIWGNLLPETSALMTEIDIPFAGMMLNVFLLIALPLSLGLWVSHKFPNFALKAKKPMKYFSLGFFLIFIVLAFAANFSYFLEYIHIVFFIVLVHNAVAFIGGYSLGSIFGISEYNKRAITLEVGLQNSGLGLILIFNFFNGLGGMAIITAFWGIWHIISAYALSQYWSKR